MNIYALESDCDRHWNLRLANEERDWDQLYRFNGTSLAATWRPIPVIADDEEIQQLPASDFPRLFSGVPVLSARAVAVLRPLLDEHGEILPLSCEDGDYFIFNVLRVVDALDESASQMIRFPNSEKVLEIKHFEFQICSTR